MVYKTPLLRNPTVVYPQKKPSTFQPAAGKVNSFPFPCFDAALTGVTFDPLGRMKLGIHQFSTPPQAPSWGAVIAPRPVMWVMLS